MQFRILAVALALILSFTASGADAKVIQSHRLTATSTVQTWESTPRGHFVYLRLYSGGKELQQSATNNCSAVYSGHGLLVSVRIKPCDGKEHPYLLHYVSTAGPRHLTVVLSVVPS